MPKQDAEYYRKYRATKKLVQGSPAEELLKRKVAACVEFLHSEVGPHVLTGAKLAAILERSILDTESYETLARRQLVDVLRGGTQAEAKPQP